MKISREALKRSYHTPFIVEDIPETLRAYPQWMVWRPERRGKQVQKAPRRASDGRVASKTDPANFSTFEAAVTGARTLGYPGIGFCLTEKDPIVALDLDRCIDPVTGEIAPFASVIIEEVDSYTELSPSRRGVHIFCTGTLPRNFNKQELEMYGHDTFVTVTGDIVL